MWREERTVHGQVNSSKRPNGRRGRVGWWCRGLNSCRCARWRWPIHVNNNISTFLSLTHTTPPPAPCEPCQWQVVLNYSQAPSPSPAVARKAFFVTKRRRLVARPHEWKLPSPHLKLTQPCHYNTLSISTRCTPPEQQKPLTEHSYIDGLIRYLFQPLSTKLYQWLLHHQLLARWDLPLDFQRPPATVDR
jgi:hypothetical protein